MTITEEVKSKNLELNLNTLASLIFSSISGISGNFLPIAEIAKNLTLNLKNELTSQSETKEIFKTFPADKDDNFQMLFLKVKKLKKEYNKGVTNFLLSNTKYKFLQVEYKVIHTKNKAAREYCYKYINKEIDHFLK